MNADQLDAGNGQPSASDSHDVREPSWRRVALAVGIILAAAAVAVPMSNVTVVTPAEPYGTGSVTIAGQTHDAVVCQSLENGIEVHHGAQGDVLHVRHMGPPEAYEDLEVKPARMGGTFLVQVTDAGERWSQPATLVGHAADGFTFRATFEGSVPVTVTHDAGGWCDGADPNRFGR